MIGAAKGGLDRIPGKPGWVVTAASDSVLVWNIDTGEKIREIPGEKFEVTALKVVNKAGSYLCAAGYHDGAVRILNLQSGKIEPLKLETPYSEQQTFQENAR